ncbi:uncharacterized protein LOC122505436 [Leptopilina heterotoma]|uniref:uncharacterized protein LOC122505436 n=1 Tax=Leptopilina heterotoma TaxID=63436 RepID=UPI001CA9E966|nr:uncharacterized protein LOC122505436 [Leptopilina heterotoma]
MYRKEQETLRQIAKASDAIRRKHRLLKMGKEAAETVLKETFQPIVTPLEKLENDFSFSTAVDEEEEFDKTLLNDSLFDKSNKKSFLDLVYGVRKLPNGSFIIGDTPVDLEGSHIQLVGKKKYLKTAGLLELLFRQEPNPALISSDDLENYKEILVATNAHRKNYSSSGLVNVTRNSKYTDVISKLFKGTPKKGRGILKKKKKQLGKKLPQFMISKKQFEPDYIYWDDPNELVDRLRLLVASQQAGNISHNNEIMSIIEELREARIIY